MLLLCFFFPVLFVFSGFGWVSGTKQRTARQKERKEGPQKERMSDTNERKSDRKEGRKKGRKEGSTKGRRKPETRKINKANQTYIEQNPSRRGGQAEPGGHGPKTTRLANTARKITRKPDNLTNMNLAAHFRPVEVTSNLDCDQGTRKGFLLPTLNTEP